MKVEIYTAGKREMLNKNGFSGVVAAVSGTYSFIVEYSDKFQIEKACEVGQRVSNARTPLFKKSDFPTLESVVEYIEKYF